MKPRYLWLSALLTAAQLISLYFVLRQHHQIVQQMLALYAVGAALVTFAFVAGAVFWVRLFQIAAALGCVVLPLVAIYGFTQIGNNGLAIMAMAAALFVHAVMILAFKLKKKPAATSASGDSIMLDEIADRGRVSLAEQSLRAQRARAIEAQKESITARGDLVELERENARLRHEVHKLRTILADPFHDPIPMEEKI